MKICLFRDLYTSIYSSFICNKQKVKTTQISINKWCMHEMCYIHRMEYYSTIKRNERNELLMHATIWIYLKIIMLNESSQIKRSSYGLISFVWSSRKFQLVFSEIKRNSECLFLGGEDWDRNEGLQKIMRKLLGMVDMYIILIVVMVSQVYKYVKIYQAVYSKTLHFTVCQFIFKKF